MRGHVRCRVVVEYELFDYCGVEHNIDVNRLTIFLVGVQCRV